MSFFALVFAAAVTTPIAAIWVMIVGSRPDRIADAVGIGAAALAWSLCLVASSVHRRMSVRTKQRAGKVANVLFLVPTIGVAVLGNTLGSSFGIGVAFFLGTFFAGFAALIVQRRRVTTPV